MMHWITYMISILLAEYLLPHVEVDTVYTAIIIAALLSAFLCIIRPLLSFLLFPLNVLTLGLFSFVVTGGAVYGISSLVPGFHVDHFGWAVLFGATVSGIHLLLSKIIC